MASVHMVSSIMLMFLLGNIISSQKSCRMEDFSVQANFDEDMFQGKWYEASWIILPWIKPEWNYNDYIQNYTKTDYGYSIYLQGRWPKDAESCVNAKMAKLYSTGENAKYIYEYSTQDGKLNASHWIVDTDYDNYALTIGCREVASNGSCVAPEGWLWTRCQKPLKSSVKRMEEKLSDYCLTKDDFSTTYHSAECRPDIQDSCQADAVANAATLTIGITAAVVTALETWFYRLII